VEAEVSVEANEMMVEIQGTLDTVRHIFPLCDAHLISFHGL
jgi:hypothetical protein